MFASVSSFHKQTHSNFTIMEKKSMKFLVIATLLATSISSCTTIDKSINASNARVNFVKSDFTISENVSGEATTVKVFFIDWARLFTSKSSSVDGGFGATGASIIGGFLEDKTANYALYNALQANPGYDVAFYPQAEVKVTKPILGLGFLTKITNAKVSTKLGKLNK